MKLYELIIRACIIFLAMLGWFFLELIWGWEPYFPKMVFFWIIGMIIGNYV